ncbi:MAG: zinc-ribbon domain-containing protein, partial [Xanthomonadaceae bacterium]|nr:zinc-ribbon domain-containing protein [Xanthomonadaceae bacterium]
MYTQCPGCRTVFEIDEDALQVSLGIVRCGHCARRFDALRTLSDSLPLAPGEALPER